MKNYHHAFVQIIPSVTQRLFGDDRHFASLLNGFLFDGQPTIDPARLTEMPDRVPVLFVPDGDKTVAIEKPWDVVKRLDDSTDFLLLGGESPKEIDSALPVRVMAYDTLQYLFQAGESSFPSAQQNTRVRARITVVIYYGSEPWNGPQSLGDLFPDSAMPFDWNGKYPAIYVLDVKRLTPEQLQLYDDTVRPLLGYLRYADEPARLRSYMEENRLFYQSLPLPLCDALLTLTKADELRTLAARHTQGGSTDLYTAVQQYLGTPVSAGTEIKPTLLFRPETFELAVHTPTRCEKLLNSFLERTDIKITHVLTGTQLLEQGSKTAPFHLCAMDNKGVFYALRVIPAGELLPADITTACRQTDRFFIGGLGAGPDDMPAVWNLFLCEKDPFGYNLAKYEIVWRVSGMDATIDDGNHLVVFNGEYHGALPLEKP